MNTTKMGKMLKSKKFNLRFLVQILAKIILHFSNFNIFPVNVIVIYNLDR